MKFYLFYDSRNDKQKKINSESQQLKKNIVNEERDFEDLK